MATEIAIAIPPVKLEAQGFISPVRRMRETVLPRTAVFFLFVFLFNIYIKCLYLDGTSLSQPQDYDIENFIYFYIFKNI